jgi:tetratricopeptide (TPR) repeat protein
LLRSAGMRRPSVLALFLAAAIAALPAGCRNTVPPGAGGATAMGEWNEWYDLDPLIDVAKTHAPAPALNAMTEAQALLRQNKAKSADSRLAKSGGSAGREWIAVARADLAALHFTMCIRGVAWRLEDGAKPSATERDVDFSEKTRIEPGDISVEALLTNLDEALAAKVPALVTQARIARARVAAFAQRCAANEDVATMAQQTVESDLATLAAEGHLTPDLAYLWAGVQMQKFSGAAARPFLLQAKDGGFDHPAVTFMLAVIALEERDLANAETLATESVARYEQMRDPEAAAEAWFVRGEVAKARNDMGAARKHYETAVKANALHVPSLLALATFVQTNKSEDEAVAYLAKKFEPLLLQGPLDRGRAQEVARNLETLVIMATDPSMVQLSRDALLEKIDAEPDAMRRGLRYFFAATLDVRLREYEMAHGHGVLAKEEFAESTFAPPVDIEAFLQRISP